MLAGEGGPQADNMDHFNRRLMRLLQDLLVDRNSALRQAQVYSTWRRLVEEVSKAGLTYESSVCPRTCKGELSRSIFVGLGLMILL